MLYGKSLLFPAPPRIRAAASVVGRKEGEGPLGEFFDRVNPDSYFGQTSWEKAESQLQRECLSLCIGRSGLSRPKLDCIFAGDLLNQCMGSAAAHSASGVPFLGLYGACSTFGEALLLAACAVSGGFAGNAAAISSSHFCSSERQFRFPLEYGGQRTPTSQWTVTGAGAAIVSSAGEIGITAATVGRIVDKGVTDANNMGAAMAPAAFDTLSRHFADTGRSADYYDLIVTGDLGRTGHELLKELFSGSGASLGEHYLDCGVIIYSEEQDTHSGGSGCGCCASVFCGYLYSGLKSGKWQRILLAPTGALMSPTSSQQGSSIPGICHAIAIERL